MMNINMYTIRLASKQKLQEMLDFLRTKISLDNKEKYYEVIIDKRLSEIYGR